MGESCSNCRVLRERAEELEEALLQARHLATGHNFTPPFCWGLTRSEAIIMRLLCAKAMVTRDQMAVAMEIEKHDWDADVKIFDVWICKIRNKLAPFGVEILAQWGQGYRIREDLRAATLEACQGGDAFVGDEIRRQKDGTTLNLSQSALVWLQANPDATIPEIARGIDINETRTRAIIWRLVEAGKVERDRAMARQHGGQPPLRHRIAHSANHGAAA